MKVHDRYEWTVTIVPVDKAEAKLNEITMGTHEVYGIHLIDHQAEGEPSATKKMLIIARQHGDVSKYLTFASAAGTNRTFDKAAPHAGVYKSLCGHMSGAKLGDNDPFPECLQCGTPVKWNLVKPQ